MPQLARIRVFPVKSLDAVAAPRASFLPHGPLRGDRQFALFDDQGEFVHAKRSARLQRLRTQFDFETRVLRISDAGNAITFALDTQRQECERWLSEYLQLGVTIRENLEVGFPDDVNATGPTVISTATLRELASWFSLDVEEMRCRLRANLEIDGVEPFWEDQLYGAQPEETVRFQVGRVMLEGVNPCQRCAVPSRGATTGEATPDFVATFTRRRRETLPPSVPLSRFDHFYRAAVNTRLVRGGGETICVGDEVRADA